MDAEQLTNGWRWDMSVEKDCIAYAILQFYNDIDETRNSYQTTGMYCLVAVT